jgi:hypothetical protein
MEKPISDTKQSIIKTLAIAGLLGLVVAIAWLAVQIVHVFPAALTSLAGMANSVYNYNPFDEKELTLGTPTTMVNEGEAFAVSWVKPHASGTYTFHYPCTDGVAISLSNDDKAFANVSCDKEYDLGDSDSVNLFINTQEERFTDVDYRIAFYRPNSTTPTASKLSTVTIVNQSISDTGATLATTTEVVAPAEVVTPEPKPVVTAPVTPDPKPPVVAATTTKPTVTTVPKPKPTTPVVTAPAPAEVTYVYEIPTSNPNGTPDLAVSILGFGTLSTNGTFTRTNSLTQKTAGAIQFAVHNIGNKTSREWSYTITFPDKTSYTSSSEKPLLPNERAVLTASFPTLSNTYLATFTITVKTTEDKASTNNTISTTEIVLVK